MTKSYRVFTFGPLASRDSNSPTTSWITASSHSVSPPLPPATLDQAVRQLSLLYQNVIFEDEEGQQDETDESLNSDPEHDATIEWPPTNVSTHTDMTNAHESGLDETYDTDITGDGMTMQSEGSSISRFPVFNFSVNMLASLSFVQSRRPDTRSLKLMILLGILEVDGPNYVTVKTGTHAGSEVCLLKLIVGDEHGAMCKLVAWRETAETWGGVGAVSGLKRGDIVLFENVLVSPPSLRSHNLPDPAKLQLTASPNLKSNAQICYRTLPRTHEDRQWRPDLRLADSVPAVRKVGEVVKWMERMAGITT